VIVNYSTGAVGVSVEARVAYLSALRPEVAALNMGSMNYAKYSPRRRDFVFNAVFANPFDEIIALLEADNLPAGAHWGVIGISRAQWLLVAAALTLGGSVRVGLEDNRYLPDGTMARSNGDLVARARRMTLDIGRRPATVAEARALLGLPARPAVAGGEALRE
jgi:3-keto-5-aminohexanoate cleavage enzyme